ncbi:MAG: class I SAM-dependent methyltransferase [Planctomycetes bacterium]|nr:class I SAM-dependent methyltransferase [Planctomycetota bacterium]
MTDPAAERARWNRKYADPAFRGAHAPNQRLAAAAASLPPGLALDLACGLGENALAVARAGHRVVALDLSDTGLARARVAVTELEVGAGVGGGVGARVRFVHGDVLRPPLRTGLWDLVSCAYFLDRALFPWIRAAVRPGGAVFYETFTEARLRLQPDFPRRFCLRPGELPELFRDWEVLSSREDPEDPYPYAMLFARRPKTLYSVPGGC